MPTRKSTTARVVYRSPEGRVTVTRTEDADYILSVDDCCAGVYTTAHAAEQAGLVELEYRVRQERWLAADEAAYAAMRDMMRRADNASLDALEQSENEHADTLGAPEPDEPTLPDDDDLAAEGLRIASPDEAGWTWRNLWVTDASPDDDEADEAEMEGMAYHAQRNAEDAAADEAAAQAAAQAMDAALDLTCSCQLCGEPVLPDQAHLVGDQMACPHCEANAYYDGRMAVAHATASPAEALAAIADLDYEDHLRADAEDAEQAACNFSDEADEAYQQAYRAGWEVMQAGRAEAPSLRLLWSWAGNAAALRGLMDERHAAWFARQERMRVTAGELGLLSREAK